MIDPPAVGFPPAPATWVPANQTDVKKAVGYELLAVSQTRTALIAGAVFGEVVNS
jgi:hypothetical protein